MLGRSIKMNHSKTVTMNVNYLMISHSSSTVLLSSEPPSAETPSLGGKEMLSDDSLLTASWALNWKINKNTLSTNVTDQYKRYFKQPLQSDSTISNANRDSVPVDFHWRIIFTCVNFTRENKNKSNV